MPHPEFKGWHKRGYLPHLDIPNRRQALTFRLADSVPKKVIEAWRSEILELDDEDQHLELGKRISHYEDLGKGNCYLGDPENAQIVVDALKHFDGSRYHLLEWCIMPNHVHVLIDCLDSIPLDQIIRS